MLPDNYIIKKGKWKGTPIKDVDRNYWIWMYDKGYLKGKLLEWVRENHPIINYGKKK